MNRRQLCLALAGATGALATAACAPGLRAASESLLISGAATMLPLTNALAQALRRQRGTLAIVVEPGGSLPAYIAARRGAIDLAAMTRPLSGDEDAPGARQYLIAREHIGILVNRALPLGQLGQVQVRALLTGATTSWRALGGPARPVTVYAHPRGNRARQSAEQLLLGGSDFAVDARECPSAAALAAAVAADPGAIGYLAGADAAMAASAHPGKLAVLAIDGVHAERSTVLSGRYPYTLGFYLLLYGAPDETRSAFVQFARSAAGQAIVSGHGLVAVC